METHICNRLLYSSSPWQHNQTIQLKVGLIRCRNYCILHKGHAKLTFTIMPLAKKQTKGAKASSTICLQAAIRTQTIIKNIKNTLQSLFLSIQHPPFRNSKICYDSVVGDARELHICILTIAERPNIAWPSSHDPGLHEYPLLSDLHTKVKTHHNHIR